MTDNLTFADVVAHQAEHLGTLQIGTFTVYRDVVKVLIVDEHGEDAAWLSIPVSELDKETVQNIRQTIVDLAPLATQAIRDSLSDAIQLVAKTVDPNLLKGAGINV
jgi:hypothetical protein